MLVSAIGSAKVVNCDVRQYLTLRDRDGFAEKYYSKVFEKRIARPSVSAACSLAFGRLHLSQEYNSSCARDGVDAFTDY